MHIQNDIQCTFKSCSQNVVAMEASYKVLSRWYLVPAWVNKFVSTHSPTCYRVCGETSMNLHIWWTCPLVHTFWTEMFGIISTLCGTSLSHEPIIAFLTRTTLNYYQVRPFLVKKMLSFFFFDPILNHVLCPRASPLCLKFLILFTLCYYLFRIKLLIGRGSPEHCPDVHPLCQWISMVSLEM